MSDRSPAPFVIGAAVAVVLAGVSAWFGATIASRPPEPAVLRPGSPPRSPELDAVLKRLADIERRLDLVEENARTALELARRRDAAPPSGDAPKTAAPGEEGAAPSNAGDTPPAGPTTEPDRNDGADGQMPRVREISRITSRGGVEHTMNLFADATQEGVSNRFAQAATEARALVMRFNLSGDESGDKIRDALVEGWERGARDIGPIVRDGLLKADIATVRDRLRLIQAETDKKLRPHFDEEKWKEYEAAVGGQRKTAEAVLAEFEKERLRLK